MILVTGGSGVVGSALVERLAVESLICLSRSGVAPRAGAQVVQGDVTKPRLGLTPERYAELCQRVDVVVNSAATTRFDAPQDEVFAVNVDGTRRILELVADAGARLVQLSTAFVSVETQAAHGWVSAKPYLDSKRAAEEVVLASGVDFHIVRPSLVIGDSRTGEAPRLQGYHFFVRSLLRDQLPVVPVGEEDRVDFVSQDLVADVVAQMALERPPASLGTGSWVTAGDEAWLVSDWVPRAIEVAREAGVELDAPRLIEPDMVERLLRPVFFPELPKRTVRRYDQVVSFSHAVVTRRPFESSLPVLRESYSEPFELELDQTFRASTLFLLRAAGVGVPA